MIDDLAVLVARPGTLHGSTKTYAESRVCEWCDTILSRYNGTKWCNFHESEARRVGNLYGGFAHGSTHEVQSDDNLRPWFRCEHCEDVYPISYQWLTADQRFCPWCKPTNAIRSDALELAS